ncbi:UDP-N-acetylmuramoyl-tripeptide--D-alanyl-D-alanine ligase [Nocardiopsis dassonvillei]|uniref:UDP-N-acetylmuramoyl-tripeptide--D-alanyl-D-alanine ligase n=1 Tax=Nocardiopsis dassonvillei (strain ATCC 23218 / DSM 43111 / CIP 107115 / JCM 7437 / KCTC 9190 / NBRC 14626 / NCTC 10488 / NRRL B-5397 / IMRU 509) TaxID=446468 RepID=D7B2Q8_NOCDD|nr:UDP-N-acetylmuramoyl-tripeptide--D-alanyl-D-alanine ligase [Nocardiopsis dassonvillei]ADH66756.1 UDP-N-acetylmuramoylalanyl-D-glutamyl-2,6-diaminopimelate/ D-alanyl-D-alanyl ligase [Nocardiopsis dassonvillei subsp. dassonvillei DSM 43111]NKY78606.1 UDP-N-acetylmuramoyl-tripeptide--D-alanyl-D-alanine ligase [Nocardiopsis dassonvillei]VEI92782.1 UDP-N-acetylmuramoyl-tripeptide--D-alanyl-D-alanine ligase [Nocardiopsis dassonvillei]
MQPLSLAQIAAAAGGQVSDADPQTQVTGVAFDSRKVSPGDLFVALRGEEGRDGHDFAPSAVRAGAVAVLAARPLDVPAIMVDDPLTALGGWARAHVEALSELDVVALTGSSGKTSTKDLIAQVLQRAGATVFTQGSFNNEIGLPITALEATADTRHLVVEMGARGQGHIAYLTQITPPRIGAVLNVGTAHAGEFGGPEMTAKAKGELVEALPSEAEGGVAVLNADDARVAAMSARTKARVVTFGVERSADVYATDVTLDGQGRASFTLHTPTGDAPVRLQVVGEHQVPNALAAAAVAEAAGMDAAQIGKALTAAESLSEGRMRVTERPDGVTVVNDAYNANADSTAAALRALAHLGRERAGRTIALLGEMRELGASSAEEHRRIGALAAVLGIDVLVAVGEGDARVLATEYGPDGRVEATKAAAGEWLSRYNFRAGDVVLVKGSNALGLGELADALAAR